MKNKFLLFMLIVCSFSVRAGSGSGTGTGSGTGAGSGKKHTTSSKTPTIASKPAMNEETFRKWVDINHDGKVSQQEIMKAIDNYFSENPNSELKSIMELIDNFFDGR